MQALSSICLLSSVPQFLEELHATGTDCIPTLVFEMSKRSLRERRRANECVEGFVIMLNILRRDTLAVRLQQRWRGLQSRKGRLSQMLMNNRKSRK